MSDLEDLSKALVEDLSKALEGRFVKENTTALKIESLEASLKVSTYKTNQIKFLGRIKTYTMVNIGDLFKEFAFEPEKEKVVDYETKVDSKYKF